MDPQATWDVHVGSRIELKDVKLAVLMVVRMSPAINVTCTEKRHVQLYGPIKPTLMPCKLFVSLVPIRYCIQKYI